MLVVSSSQTFIPGYLLEEITQELHFFRNPNQKLPRPCVSPVAMAVLVKTTAWHRSQDWEQGLSSLPSV